MNVLYIVADSEKEYNSANWRCDMPIEAINTLKEHRAKKLFIKDWVEGQDKIHSTWADVIVLQRNVVAGGFWMAAEWMARGKTVLVDIDDGYEYMPQSNISAQFWINRQTQKDGKTVALPFDPLVHLKMGLKLCDAITTPSKVIVNDRKGINKTILVPNYPKVDMYIEAARRYNESVTRSDRILLGWGGGGSHFDSFMLSGVVPAMLRVLDKRKNVDILIMGPREVAQAMTAKDKRLYGRVKAEPWGKYNEWPDRLARLDVAVAPLQGNYDKRRSWLKAIEYTLAGIPWVGTDFRETPQPYGDFPAYHLVRNQSKYWEEALLNVIDNIEDARKCMKQEQEWAKQFDLFANAKNIIGAYTEVCNG